MNQYSQLLTSSYSHGLAPRVISRHDLMKVLYENFSNEVYQNILGNKKLSDIQSTPDGVVVSCSDGSSYHGSMVIGADGAHSAVRDIMRTLSIEAGITEVNPERPFTTTYRALWVRFPRNASLPIGLTCETHGRNATTQLFVGEASGVIGVYETMEQPTTERIRYTREDQDALVGRWGHLPVTPDRKVTLRDIYESRLESGLVSLEEGTLDHWSWNGRIVLAGDAAHKFTPSTGAGCNNGMLDIVSLVNELHVACKTSGSGSPQRKTVPTHAEVQQAFTAYQTSRQSTVASECARASQATSTATWQTKVHELVDRHVMSNHMVQRVMIRSGAKGMARTPAFCFTTGQMLPEAKVPWSTAIIQ